MKARKKGGVVDERLNVYGVEGLKLAGAFYLRLQSYLAGYLLTAYSSHNEDLSICPGNVGAVSTGVSMRAQSGKD